MSLIRIISQKANEQQLPFLLIGGYAVMAHGFARSTYDLDFLIRKNQTEDWRQLLECLDFKIHFAGPTFLQFDPPSGEKLPLDVMFVSDETFTRMQAEAKRVEADGVATSIVSLPHLIALKCHAIRHGKPQRAIKDIEDLVQLTRLNKLDLNSRPSVTSFSSTEIKNFMKHSNATVAGFVLNDAPTDLEFPDWSGLKPHRVRLSPAEAFRWNEEMIALFPAPKHLRRKSSSTKCGVEFKL